jgi:hypothetical protein
VHAASEETGDFEREREQGISLADFEGIDGLAHQNAERAMGLLAFVNLALLCRPRGHDWA